MPKKIDLESALEKIYEVKESSGSSGVIITPNVLRGKKVKLTLMEGEKGGKKWK